MSLPLDDFSLHCFEFFITDSAIVFELREMSKLLDIRTGRHRSTLPLHLPLQFLDLLIDQADYLARIMHFLFGELRGAAFSTPDEAFAVAEQFCKEPEPVVSLKNCVIRDDEDRFCSRAGFLA